ncbi:O-antigen ligase family protein [Sinorhizobium meliloti]|uniref:O-antigen ligase family protein n=1 Tax=Rhizobium meliloti TaxID=382 RepID=UPI000FDADC79|nr:O-antigen ligase family protein [Sinorhizobium meliloti]RVH36138.1 O-antigen ligase family protein [Sinorhizobium meliloti]
MKIVARAAEAPLDPLTSGTAAEMRPRASRYGLRSSHRSGTLRSKTGLRLPVAIFLIGLVIPWVIPLGTFNLSVYRFVLVGTLPLSLIMWVRGKAGRIRVPDIGFILFSLWVGITLVAAHGIDSAVEPAGILFIETVGAYFLGRCFIRSAGDLYKMTLLWAKVVILLSPFALYEWISGSKPILTALSAIFPTVEITTMGPRWGFWRVQGPFSHPIEFGLFCGSLLAVAYVILGRGRGVLRWLLPAAVGATAFLSMSSAPIAGLMIQTALTGWNWFLGKIKYRWKILWGLAFIAYLVVEFGSNQTPVKFYISHFTFDAQTGWYRLAIWEFGSASVLNHPILGIGLTEYARPSWMGSASVDNFWLLIAIRHGIPAVVLMLGSCLWLTGAMAFKKGLDEKEDTFRLSLLISLMALFFVGCTVHFHGATYVWLMFLLGSSVWTLDARPGEKSLADSSVETFVVRSRGLPGRPRPRIDSSRCDVLTGSADHPINRIDDLLPWNIAPEPRLDNFRLYS